MARGKAKNVGKGATIITLLSNPVVRRAVITGATRAANSTAKFLAARSAKAGSTAGTPQPAAPESQATVVPKPAAKPASLTESAAVESIIGSLASMAKPVAERLAASSAGRSVLEAVNSISGQVLGAAGPPKRAGASVSNFVGSILAGQSSQKPNQRPPDRP